MHKSSRAYQTYASPAFRGYSWYRPEQSACVSGCSSTPSATNNPRAAVSTSGSVAELTSIFQSRNALGGSQLLFLWVFFVRARSLFLLMPPSVHLAWEDMAVDSATVPTKVRFHLRWSKTAQFGQGVDVFVTVISVGSGSICQGKG